MLQGALVVVLLLPGDGNGAVGVGLAEEVSFFCSAGQPFLQVLQGPLVQAELRASPAEVAVRTSSGMGVTQVLGGFGAGFPGDEVVVQMSLAQLESRQRPGQLPDPAVPTVLDCGVLGCHQVRALGGKPPPSLVRIGQLLWLASVSKLAKFDRGVVRSDEAIGRVRGVGAKLHQAP